MEKGACWQAVGQSGMGPTRERVKWSCHLIVIPPLPSGPPICRPSWDSPLHRVHRHAEQLSVLTTSHTARNDGLQLSELVPAIYLGRNLNDTFDSSGIDLLENGHHRGAG